VKAKAFQVSFKSDLYKMRDVLHIALEFINKHEPELEKNNLKEIKLILSELLSNAVIHGNKKIINKRVYLKLELKEKSVFAKILDEGRGFDHVKYIANYKHDKNLIKKESGRGIKIVSYLADAIAFNALGNEIKFFKKIF